MPVDLSQWSQNRHSARNRIEKHLSQTRVFANEIVKHFSEAACEAIANAADDEVRSLIAKERSRLERDSLKEHQEDVQTTFALAAVAEVARGDKSPEELAKAVIDTESVDALIVIFDELEVDTIDRIAAIGNRLTAACDAVRVKRAKPAAPKADAAAEPAESPADSPEPAKKSAKAKKPASDASPDATEGTDATS
jgi:acetyl/propionyl-CoA carboxylase alpha subunit